MKLRGCGGVLRYWDDFLDSFSLVTGLAEATQRIRLYASVAVLTMPPALTARMAATIDDISQGRFGVNIVAGWIRDEYAQMGIWPGDSWYRDRYVYAEEYVAIMRELWTTGRSDFHGSFFQLEDCRLGPLPRNEIEVVFAGTSASTLSMTARLGNVALTPGTSIEELTSVAAELERMAAGSGRDVEAWPVLPVVIDETDDGAQRRLRRIQEGLDIEAYAHLTGQAAADVTGGFSKTMGNDGDFRVFANQPPVVGSPETVAEKLRDVAAATGCTGFMLTFDDYMRGTELFGTQTIPLLRTATPR